MNEPGTSLAAAPRLLVFSDLDGTLLDERYRHEEAAPALARLRALGIPLVLCSSKTLPEMRLVHTRLGLADPLVFENGAGIAVPEGYFESGARAGGRLEPETFGPGYAELRRLLAELCEERGYPFRGFGDMDAAEVARRTGLDEVSAARARLRIGSEPGVWEGSEAIRQDFLRDLSARGLRAVRGGRFLHVMPAVDKATAVQALLERYRAAIPDAHWSTVAAGDSPNDADMLRAADHAIVIRGTDGTWMPLPRRPGLRRSTVAGPAGWNECMLALLDAQASAAGPGETR